MLSALAGRLITGPLAFFLAGCLDIGLFGLGLLRRRLAGRKRVSR